MLIFPLYEDARRVMAKLSDEQFGQVVRYAMDTYFDEQAEASADVLVETLATMLLEQVSRYDQYRQQQREKRSKKPACDGQNPSDGEKEQVSQTDDNQVEQSATNDNQREQSATNGNQVQPPNPNPSPSPNPIPNPKNNIICSTAVELLNSLSGSSFRATTKATQRLLAARCKEGFTPEDIETVIRHQCTLWGKDPRMRMYLRPETLFGSKFESYLSDAKRQAAQEEEECYILAPLEDPWEVAMRNGGYHG